MSHHSRSLSLKVFAHTFSVFLFLAYFCANWHIVPYATRTHTPGNTWCRAPGEFWKLCFDAGECGISLCANVNKQYVSDSNWVSVMYIYRGHSWLNVTIRNSSIMNICIQNTWIDLCWKSLFLKLFSFFFSHWSDVHCNILGKPLYIFSFHTSCFHNWVHHGTRSQGSEEDTRRSKKSEFLPKWTGMFDED